MNDSRIRPSLIRAAGLCLALPLWAGWVPLGPFGGSASIVVSDPNCSGTLVAGARNALLFRSRDGGESWTPLAFPAQLHATLNALAIDPLTPGIYLAGVSGESSQFAGILRSDDAGATWRQIPDFRNQQVRAIAFKKASSKIVAAGTDSGVFLSQDGGVEWTRISPEDNGQLQPIVSLAFDPRDGATLYAGTPHLPWKTSDGGATWHSIHAGMIDDSDVFSILVDRNRPQRLFAGACSGFYRSLNSGATWTRLMDARDAAYRTYVIAQDPIYENVWFAGTTNGILRSPDGGATWEKLGAFATRSIAFDPATSGRIFIAADEAGILRSDDNGKTWQPVNKGFCNRWLSSLWTAAGAAYTAIPDGAASGGIFRLAVEGDAWEKLPPLATIAEPGVYDVIPTRGRGLLAATASGLRASEDLGASWHPVPGELETDTIQALCRHPLRTALLYAAKYGVIYTSADGGRSWRRISPEASPIGSVKQLLVLPGSPDRLLVLTHQQGVWEWPLDSASPQSLAGR